MRVGIVGAGITGLAVHHHLRRRGAESIVFEADSQPGGVIRSVRCDGDVLELGPQRTRLSPPVRELVDAAGLDGMVRESRDHPLYVYRDGRLRQVPKSAREAAGTDLLSWRGKLRALAEPLTTPLTGPPGADETVESFFTRTFGREFATFLAGPLYAGLYASHPDEMPVRHSLSRALAAHGISGSLLVAAAKKSLKGRDPPPVVTFEDGLQSLPEALAERYADGVRLDTSVQTIRDDGEGFAIETREGIESVDAVVLTTPADVTAKLLDPLPSADAEALADLRYNPMAVVHLCASGDLDAAGYQVQYDEDFRTLGVTATASLFDCRENYACYLGGSKTPEVVEWSDEKLAQTATTEFETITGLDAEVVSVYRLPRGMPAYDASWDALDDVVLPDGVHLCANYESRAGIPGRAREAERLARKLADG